MVGFFKEHSISKSYFLNVDGYAFGPIGAEKIVELLKAKKISINDQIYIESQKQWQLVGDLEEVSDFLPEKPNIDIPAPRVYLFKSNKKRGPYNLKELNFMLSGKTISAFDFAYLEGEQNWQSIRNHPRLSKLLKENPKNEIFEKSSEQNVPEYDLPINEDNFLENYKQKYGREYTRAGFSGYATMSTEVGDYHGRCTNISEGGCFIQVNPHGMLANKKIDLSILPDLLQLSIQSTVRVAYISNQYPQGVGLQFLNLNRNTKNEIRKFVDRYTTNTGGGSF